ncbi:MAG: penicillin acylase family protein [Acidimicrobiales bacterium]|jgi:acyl-homoserine-lactone acylase|nr:penicillin acylase family protein [Acidimicrobiales bacterium]
MHIAPPRVRRPLVALLAACLLVTAACSDDAEEASSPGTTDGSTAADGGTTTGDGTYSATIRRTTDGVPHITADDLGSLSFGQGYASGQDRLCDLADQLVRIRGERAKWFGPGENDANLNSDLAWRSLGVYETAVAEYPEKSEEVRSLLDGFAAGWSDYLTETGVDEVPGWCAGAEWVEPVTGEDVYAYARAITLQASSSRLLDYIAKAQPPATDTTTGTSEGAVGQPVSLVPEVTASNGWAIGTDRSENGGGMLIANPHFPWEGALRFWEVHLTIPGEQNIYGAQLGGLPGVGIGFTETFGWTHTVSAGNRFTAYSLDLVPGAPTTYRYGDEEREMTSEEVTVEVLQPDGTVTEETRTMWSSHYGPILDFPGVGWTAEQVITYRDANIDNDEFIDQYLAMDRAESLDELMAAHEEFQGVPLFNTVAVSADGRAWYADTSATPNLSDEALVAYETSLTADPLVAAAAQSRAILLDGSDPLFEWVDEEGARDPGLVPYADMPQVERSDYVFNANDSFWVANADEVLEGDYSPLHGRQDTARSPRTRENAAVLDDTSAEGPAGDDGAFSLDELADAALRNGGYTARALREDVAARCEGVGTVSVPPLAANDGSEALPAADVDITKACDVLADWDGIYDLDSVGAVVWREFVTRFTFTELTEAGPLWAEPFDPAQPVETPSGLAPPPDGGASNDTVLVNLARAVQILEAAGIPVDAPLGEVQLADRNGTMVPIHGGDNNDGTTNIVGYSTGKDTMEEIPRRGPTFAPRSGLSADGYLINNGTSFLLALSYGEDGPQARAFLTYGETEDRESPLFTSATQRFSDKDWRTVVFTEEDIAADPELTEVVVEG